MPHIHEKIDFTSEVYIVHQGRVLLRVHDKYGFWLGVGGHIELDEDPNEAAVREVKEEVGLDVRLFSAASELSTYGDFRELINPLFLNRHHITETHEHVTHIYAASAETDVIDPASITEKLTQTRWFTAEELSDPQYDIAPIVQKYAAEALRLLASPS